MSGDILADIRKALDLIKRPPHVWYCPSEDIAERVEDALSAAGITDDAVYVSPFVGEGSIMFGQRCKVLFDARRLT